MRYKVLVMAKLNTARRVGFKCEKGRCEKMRKRAEKMCKESSFLRKQALLCENKVFILKRVHTKHNMNEL